MSPEPLRSAHEKYRIFVVDDHPLVRESLRNLLNQQLDLSVCGEAEDAPRALSAIIAQKPHVAVVDLSLKTGSGMDLIKDLKVHCPRVAIVVLSMHDENLYAERVLRAGARGYVMKRETTKNILAAIRRVLGGGVYVSEAFSDVMAERLVTGRPIQPGPTSLVEQLSDRELEVFRSLGIGKGTSQIASDLHLSPKTVQAYCARIKVKLGLANAHELMREAVRFVERATGAD
jgi:DNA-binding NarL/FixJ family response regulator